MTDILALSSYGVGNQVGSNYPPVSVFTDELARLCESSVSVVTHHGRSLNSHAEYLRGMGSPPALIYACGSSVMEVALNFLTETGMSHVPIIYWGSHILDCGEIVNPQPTSPSVCGIELPMPLYHSHRQFRILRLLFPNIEKVYCVFSMDSAFIRDERRKRYDCARQNNRAWIPSNSELSAFPGLARLGALIDVEVFEHPCAAPETVVKAIRAIEHKNAPGDVHACLVSCIDCFHVDGALEALSEAAHQVGIPFVALNLGTFFSEYGPVISCESDLDGAARIAAGMAKTILADGLTPSSIGIVDYRKFLFRCNTPLSAKWELPFSDRTQSRITESFDRLIFQPSKEPT